MKKVLITVYATIFFFSCLLVKAQVTRSNTNVSQPVNPQTIPVNISQLEVSGRLITQNAFVGTGAIPTAQQTGNFGNTARWNSMGSLNAGTQTLNGFRTQTDGRGLVLGYSINNSTTALSNPFIQWGGNVNSTVSPGNLEFRSFTDPTAVNALHRLSMRQNGTFYFGLTVPTSTNEDPWVQIDNQNANVANSSIGIKSNATKGAVENIGVYGLAFPIGVPTTEFNYGVRGESSGPNSYGEYGQTNGFNAFSVGVYGTASGRNSYAGFFDGDVYAAGLYLGSDMKLKKNIVGVSNTLNKVFKLRPVNYDFDTQKVSYLNLTEGTQTGFIAQEVEQLFPEIVKEISKPTYTSTNSGQMEQYKSINYIALIPILTKAIQELQQMIETLNQKVEQLQYASNTATANSNGYILSQNVPNPFTSNTIISYQLPANSGNAIIAVFDLTGKMLLQYNLAKAGNQITINGSSLAAGIYIYSLIVNGSEVVSKKMVLTK
jgi:hypothetical protein